MEEKVTPFEEILDNIARKEKQEEEIPKFFQNRHLSDDEKRELVLENELKKQQEKDAEKLPLDRAFEKTAKKETVEEKEQNEEVFEEPVEEEIKEEVKEDTVKYTLKLGEKYINRVRFETDEMLAILFTGNPDLAHKFSENELKGKLLEYIKDLGVKAMVSKTIYEEVDL